MLITDLYLFRSSIGHILVLIEKLYLLKSTVGVTELILIPILLADLYLYRGTPRYYRPYTYTEVPVGTFREKRCTLLSFYSYSNFYHVTVGLPVPVIRNE